MYGVPAYDIPIRSEVLLGVMGDPDFKEYVMPRLLQECTQQNSRLPRDVQLDEAELSRAAELEWLDTEAQASSESGHLCKLAIFAYAYAYERPIVVVGETKEDDTADCLLGVYLPKSDDGDGRVSKEPLAIYYNGQDHFTSLVFPPGSVGTERLLSLHDITGKPLPVRFVLQGDEQSQKINHQLNTKAFNTSAGDMVYAVVSDDSVLAETKAMMACLKDLRNIRPQGD